MDLAVTAEPSCDTFANALGWRAARGRHSRTRWGFSPPTQGQGVV